MYFLVQNNHTVLSEICRYVHILHTKHVSYNLQTIPTFKPFVVSTTWCIYLFIWFHIYFKAWFFWHCDLLLVVYQTVFSSILAFVEILMALYDVYNIYKLIYVYIQTTTTTYKNFCILQVNFRICTLHLPHLIYFKTLK